MPAGAFPNEVSRPRQFSPPRGVEIERANSIGSIWRLAALNADPDQGLIKAEPFFAYRTVADRRFLDLSLDPSDRPVARNRHMSHGRLTWGGSPRCVPSSACGARVCHSLTSCMARCSVPGLNVMYSVYKLVFPAQCDTVIPKESFSVVWEFAMSALGLLVQVTDLWIDGKRLDLTVCVPPSDLLTIGVFGGVFPIDLDVVNHDRWASSRLGAVQKTPTQDPSL